MNTSLPIKRAFYAFFGFLLFSPLTSIFAQTCPNNLLSNGSLENGTFSATTVSGITTQMTTYGGSTSVFLPFTASGVWDHPISNFVANTGYWVDASTNGGSGSKDLNRLFVIPANTGTNRCLWPTNSTGFTHTVGNCYRICFWAAQFDPSSPNNASLNSKINFEVLDQWGTSTPATVSNFSVTPASTDVGSNYTISTFDLPASTNVKTITGATYTGASGQVVDWKTLNWQYICLDFTPLLANGRVEIYLSTTNTGQNGVALDGLCATSGNCGVTCTPPAAPAVTNANRCGIGSLTATISTTCASGSTLKIFSNSNLTTDVTSSFTIASGSVTSGNLSSTTDYYAACQSTSDANCKSTGDLFTLTVNTEPTATAAATQPNCNGVNAPNNGAITLTGGSGLRYQYSAGATFNSGSTTPSSITTIPSGGVITSSLPNTSGDYTVRIYHTSDNTCYVDRKVTIIAANCCTKPYAGADKYLACTGTALTTTTNLAGFSPSGGTWAAQTGNPVNANITNTGAVTGMTKTGIYKFIYTVTGNCSDTVAVTVGSCACNTTCFRTLGNANNCDGTTHGAGISYFSNGLVVEKLYAQDVILKECVAEGTASITGVLTKNPDGTGEKFTIDFNYSGYSTTNPGPEPFHQNECATVTDFSDWHWYSTVTGTITSNVSGVYTITRYGPATQIGTNAGEKFLGYGIGGWHEHSQSFHTGYFDFWAPIGELQCPCVKPNAGPDAAAVCQPTSTSKLTAVTTGGTWAPQANNPSAAIIDANGNISGLNTAGTYKFIYSVTGAGNTCTDTAQVVVNAKPKITDGTATICAGEPLDLTSKITGYATFLNPKWTINTTTGTTVATPAAVKPTSNTTYFLVAQNDNGCRDTANVAVTVNPKPSAGNDQTLACANNILTKSTTLAPNPSGGIWTQIGNTPTAATINGNSIANMNAAGTYQFIYTLNGCKDMVAVTVEPCTPCVKPNAGPDQTLTCVNGNPPTSFDLVDAAAGQKWKIISPVPAGASITVLTPSGAVSGTIVAGTYKFRLQNQNDSLACADTVQVIVPDCTPGTDPICFSSSRVVTDNKLGAVCTPPVTPEVFYSFFLILKNNTGTHDRFKNSNLKFEEYCDGTAKIYGTVCSITDPNLCLDVVYNLSGRTTTPPAGSPYAGLCNSNTSGFYYYTGGSGTITGKSGSGFNNLSITIVREGAAFQVGVGANTNENVFGAGGWFKPTIVNDGDGNWTAEVVSSSGIVHGDFNLNLSTTQTPLYNLTATGSVVCEGQSATLTANLDEKCTVTYKWTGPNGFSATGASVTVPNATATGVYTVTAEITSATGNKCSKSDTAIVTVIPKPTVVVINGFPACRQNGTAYSIKFTKSPSGAVVTAKNVATGAVIAVTGDSVANIPLTVAKVRLIVTNGACKDSIEVSAPTCDKPVGSIGDLIWKDVNDNGLQDLPTEKGVSGIKVNLYSAAGGTKTGTILQTKTTGNDGLYLFTGLLAGDYIVEIDKTTLPDTCTITSKQDIPSDDSKDSDFDPTTGLSQVVTLNPMFNPTTPTEILATNNLTVDAGLVVPCIKFKVTLTNTPICSADLQTYSFTFNVTGKNGTIKVNKGTLTGNNPYTVTGIPSGATVKITDSLSAVCKFDTLITGPNCNCNPSLPKLVTSSFTACIGDTFPTLKATVVGLATVEWFATETSTTVLFTGLNFKPSGTITGNTFFYAQARSTDPACPAAISTSRVMATINAQDCNKEVDLALKKSINTKIAQIGDVLTYTLKVWNESDNNATGVEVSDSIATTVQFQTGSFVASRGTATITGNVIKWAIGNIAANGDTVTLTYRVKATQEGVHFNTAEICKTNEKDVDSTPCNNKDDEDDIDRQCFTVPIKLCPNSKIQASVSSIYTNVQWFKDGNQTPIATGNIVLLSDVGSYTYTATNQTCPAGGCCPIIIEEGLNCCPTELCIPYVVKKLKKQ